MSYYHNVIAGNLIIEEDRSVSFCFILAADIASEVHHIYDLKKGNHTDKYGKNNAPILYWYEEKSVAAV